MVKMGMKRTTPKKPIKKSRNTTKRKLDKMFSDYIRRIGYCEFCGSKDKQLHCHHGIVHRRYMNTRYLPENVACVCAGCHRYLGEFSKVNTEFFTKRVGSDRYEQIEILARSGGKVDLEAIEIELKNKLGRIAEILR